MKKYALDPTYENLLDTYIQDAIGRNDDVFLFCDILNSIEGSCSIALDGRWGSGKTFFVRQTKMILDAHNSLLNTINEEDVQKIVGRRSVYYSSQRTELRPQLCVYYDAWENDSDDDPILSLVYTIMNSMNTHFSFTDRSYIELGVHILDIFSQQNWSEVINSLKGNNLLSGLRDTKDIEQKIHAFFEAVLAERGERLVILIDELDRCKPSYAVRLLERIKHYFSDEKITFVFAINTHELQHTIKNYYGTGFDGSKYLDRFFDFRVTLPPPDLQKYFQTIHFNDSYYTYDVISVAIIKTFHFELREISRYLQICKIAKVDPENRRLSRFRDRDALKFCMLYIVPIMIGLKIHNTQQYLGFIQGKDHTPLLSVASALDIRFYQQLLEFNQTYDQADTTKIVVTLGDKLKAVYDALFVTPYGIDTSSVTVGNLTFVEHTKSELLHVSGLLSRFANWED